MLQIRVIRVVIKQRVERVNTSRSAKLFVTKIDRARDREDFSYQLRQARPGKVDTGEVYLLIRVRRDA